MRILTLVALLLLAGASNAEPYLEFGLGYQIDKHSDYRVQTRRKDQCQNPKAILAAGWQFKKGWRIEYHHESWLMCGSPFGNSKPEIYADDIRIMFRF